MIVRCPRQTRLRRLKRLQGSSRTKMSLSPFTLLIARIHILEIRGRGEGPEWAHDMHCEHSSDYCVYAAQRCDHARFAAAGRTMFCRSRIRIPRQFVKAKIPLLCILSRESRALSGRRIQRKQLSVAPQPWWPPFKVQIQSWRSYCRAQSLTSESVAFISPAQR
jgi:hypothetical protein